MEFLKIQEYQNTDYKKLLKENDLESYYMLDDKLVIVEWVLPKYKNKQTYYKTTTEIVKHASKFKKLSKKQIKMIARSKKIKKIIN